MCFGGLHTSVDAGRTWTRPRRPDFPFAGTDFQLAIDPITPHTLYVAANSLGLAEPGEFFGDEAWLMKSIDDRQPWVRVARGSPHASFWALATNPANGSVYVGTNRDGVLVCTACSSRPFQS